jgi:ferritin-like metal-binding protein YciE
MWTRDQAGSGLLEKTNTPTFRANISEGRKIMAESKKDMLVMWLRDAYSMEKQAIDMLQSHAGRLENYPELKARTEQHLGQTRVQADRVQDCLSRLGADTSTIKELTARFTAGVQAVMGTTAGDEVVKNAMGDYTFEHFEISSYRCLIATAEEVGEPEIARILGQNLREEEEQAAWLADHLPQVTRQYLQKLEAAGGDTSSAKR